MELSFQTFLDEFGVDATFTPIPVGGAPQPTRPVRCIVNTEPKAFARSETLSFPPEVGLSLRHVEAVFRSTDVVDMTRGAAVAVGGKSYRVEEVIVEVVPPGVDGTTSALLKDRG